MHRMSFAVLALFLSLSVFAQIEEGDRHFANRAEGAQGERARSGPVDAAVAAYQRALAQDANNLEAHWKLLRAYRYKGAYTAANNEQKKQIYGVAKTAGEKAVAAAYRKLGLTPKSSEKQVAEASRRVPGSAEIFLWDAVNWGEWALAYGKLAAAREGAADRIRRQATIAHLADPRLEGGAPSRVLGRLHDQTPRIPFVTGWASSKEAVKFLNESMKIAPDNKLTQLFLAEALVKDDSSKKPEAIRMLQGVISSPNDPLYPVEDAAAVEDAKALLARK